MTRDPYPPGPPASFREGVERAELELHGVRARAFQFRGGVRDRTRALVCVAGMGADGRSFVRQRPLAGEWWVLPLDLPCDTPAAADPLEFAAEVVEEYCASERLVRPVLLGSSFGGAVATLVALRGRARPGALVLAAAALSHREMPFATTLLVDLLEAPDPLARLVSPIAAQIMGGFGLDREARDELVREARHFTGRELKRRLLALLATDLLPELPGLRLPVLFVHGSRDLLVRWRASRRAASLVDGARFELVRHAGHVPHLSHPAQFNAILGGFLASLAGELGRLAALRPG